MRRKGVRLRGGIITTRPCLTHGSSMKSHLILLLALFSFKASACVDHQLRDAAASVQVVEPSVTAAQRDGCVLLTVLGSVKNNGGERVESLLVEAKLKDASGKTIDVISQPVHGLVVPAGQQVAFRLLAPAAAAPAMYAGVEARVVSAEAHVPFVPPPPARAENEPNVFVSLLVSWAPMLLLIAVWVLLARKFSGKGSTQDKMLTAIGEQNALLARQIAAIEAIASAAAAKKAANEA